MLLTRSSGLGAVPLGPAPASRAPRHPVLPISLLEAPTATSGETIIGGKTTPKGRVKLDIGGDGSVDQTVKANKKGRFQFIFQVGFGATFVEVIGPGSSRTAHIGMLTVSRPNPPPPPVMTSPTLTSFQIDTPRILAGSDERIVFTAAVANASPGTQVELFTSDASGNLGGELAPMLDNGSALNGDARKGDGTYSNTFSLNEATAGDYFFAAEIVGGSAPPTVVHLTAVAAPSQQRVQDLQTQTETLSNQLTNALNSGQSAADALGGVRQALLAHPELTDPASIDVNARGIAWTSTEGIRSALFLDSLTAGLKGSSSGVTDPASGPAGGTASPAAAMPMLCGSAKTIAPFAWQFEPFDESDEIAAALSAAGVSVTSVANAAKGDQTVTLDDYTNFSPYTTVEISCHGAEFAKYGVLLDTGVQVSLLSGIAHLGDLISGRLLFGINIGGGKSDYLISPSWVSRYSGRMDDSIIYVSACHSTDGDTMANAFLNNGAAAYLGYTDTVNSGFSNGIGIAAYQHLINGGTVGTIPGLNTQDPIAPNATFTLVAPDDTVKLPNPCGIENLFVSYRWPNTQRDLDTSTSLFGSSVGFACDNNSPFLDWSGDDTSAGGTETVVVHLKESHDQGLWTDTVTVNLDAGWYIPAGGSGPALLSVGLIDPMTGDVKDVVQRSIDPGAQTSCAMTPVGLVTINVTGPPGMETETFTLT